MSPIERKRRNYHDKYCIYTNVSPLFSPPLEASGLALSVGPVGPLSRGEDELMYAVVSGGEEDLVVTAIMDTQDLTCRPTSIMSFKSDCCSVTSLASGHGSAEGGAVEDYHMPAGPATTSGVAEVSGTDSHLQQLRKLTCGHLSLKHMSSLWISRYFDCKKQTRNNTHQNKGLR